MSVEENLRVIDSANDAVNARDWDRLLRLTAESVIDYDPATPEPRKGRAALRQSFQDLITAFPDLHGRKERSFGQGDWVSLELTVTGTHKGPLPGPGGQMIPATNKPFRTKQAIVFKLEGGEITEVYEYYDLLGMMAQLGLTK